MNIYLKSIAASGPGFESWETLRAHFAAGASLQIGYEAKPQGNALPPVERRRASRTVKIAVDVAQAALQQSGLNAEDLALVFASSGGDTDTLNQICASLATSERFVSPTSFHNSVHNAAAGYWSIGAASMQPSTTLCAWKYTPAAALIEAATQCQTERIPVLMTVFDTPFPGPLHDAMPVQHAFGAAFVLDANPQGSLAQLSLTVGEHGGQPATSMDGELEKLRLDSPAAHILPLLAALAANASQTVILDCADGLQLRIEIEPAH